MTIINNTLVDQVVTKCIWSVLVRGQMSKFLISIFSSLNNLYISVKMSAVKQKSCQTKSTVTKYLYLLTCAVVDLCAEGKHHCEQICISSPGSFTCDCNQGYQLNDDLKSCSSQYQIQPTSTSPLPVASAALVGSTFILNRSFQPLPNQKPLAPF